MVKLRDGYVVDLIYTPNWKSELSPASLSLMLMMSGMQPLGANRPVCLELGFGRGLSLNVIAAANQGEFHGVDFIEEHVDEACARAAASGAPLSVSAASFTEFAEAPGGEDFDVITLHGVWSWVDDASRAAIVRILSRRLKPGGAALISYNTPAGWAPLDPLRELFLLNSAASGADPAKAMTSGIALADRLAAAGGKYFEDAPSATRQLDKVRGRDPHYLVHEYLNEGHRTFSFAATQKLLAGADLTYVGPARFAEYIDRRRLSGDAAKIVSELTDQPLAEMARDLLQAQRFRSDLYVKGTPRPLGSDPELLLSSRFTALTDRMSALPETEVVTFRNTCEQTFEFLLSEGASPKSFGDIVAGMPNVEVSYVGLTLMSLCATECVAPLALAGATDCAKTHNRNELATADLGTAVLASPLTGGVAPANPLDQLFLASEIEGTSDPAAFVWKRMNAQGKVISSGGVAIDGEEGNVDFLRRAAEVFQGRGLQRYRRLGVV